MFANSTSIHRCLDRMTNINTYRSGGLTSFLSASVSPALARSSFRLSFKNSSSSQKVLKSSWDSWVATCEFNDHHSGGPTQSHWGVLGKIAISWYEVPMRNILLVLIIMFWDIPRLCCATLKTVAAFSKLTLRWSMRFVHGGCMEASGSSRPTGSIAKRKEKKDAPIGKYQVAIFSPSILSYFFASWHLLNAASCNRDMQSLMHACNAWWIHPKLITEILINMIKIYDQSSPKSFATPYGWGIMAPERSSRSSRLMIASPSTSSLRPGEWRSYSELYHVVQNLGIRRIRIDLFMLRYPYHGTTTHAVVIATKGKWCSCLYVYSVSWACASDHAWTLVFSDFYPIYPIYASNIRCSIMFPKLCWGTPQPKWPSVHETSNHISPFWVPRPQWQQWETLI